MRRMTKKKNKKRSPKRKKLSKKASKKPKCNYRNPAPPCKRGYYSKKRPNGSRCCYKETAAMKKKRSSKRKKSSKKTSKKPKCNYRNPAPPCKRGYYPKKRLNGSRCCYKETTAMKKKKKKTQKRRTRLTNKTNRLSKNLENNPKIWYKFRGSMPIEIAYLQYLQKIVPNTCISKARFEFDRITLKLSEVYSKRHNYKPGSVITDIKKCFRTKKRFVVVWFSLKTRNIKIKRGKRKQGRHANSLIFDKKYKTVTRFEPHGGKKDKWVKVHILKWMRSNLPGWSYKEPSSYCPYYGPQTKAYKAKKDLDPRKFDPVFLAKEAGGFCAAWNLFFIHLRIVNPNKTDKEVMNIMMNWTQTQLANKIRHFAAFVCKQTKKCKNPPKK
jgi:hypothetical protein